MSTEPNFEKELLRLLEQYHHYRFMTSGLFSNPYRMNLYKFMEWLKSRQKQ